MITEIKGLRYCTMLKKLFITNNKLSKIEGLDQLVNLEILWLSEN